jgi:hypothetical protein
MAAIGHVIHDALDRPDGREGLKRLRCPALFVRLRPPGRMEPAVAA